MIEDQHNATDQQNQKHQFKEDVLRETNNNSNKSFKIDNNLEEDQKEEIPLERNLKIKLYYFQ